MTKVSTQVHDTALSGVAAQLLDCGMKQGRVGTKRLMVGRTIALRQVMPGVIALSYTSLCLCG
jgi:hypothetical protein